MTDLAAMPYKSQFALGASSPPTQALVIDSESIGVDKKILDGAGINGERDSNILHRQVEDVKLIQGGFELMPTKSFLDFFLTYIIGGTESVDVWVPLQSEIPDFLIEIDRLTKVFTYSKCKVNTATFSAAKGELLKLAVDILGEAETIGAAGSATSLTPDQDTPFAFSDSTLTFSGATRLVESFSLTFDNKLKGDRHFNSINLTDIPSGGFAISGTVKVPYTSNNQALYDLVGEITGASLKMEFESASTGKYLEFLMPNVTISGDGSPKISGKDDELFMELPFTAHRDSITPTNSITITNAETKP